MNELVRLQEVIDHRRAIDGDGQGLLDGVDGRDAADIAVVDALVVVVDRLHHLVADAKGAAAQPPLRLAPRRVERLLEHLVQVRHPRLPVVHRGQHLDIVERVEAEFVRHAPGDHVHQQFGRLGRVFLDEQEEVPRVGACFRHQALVDAMGIADDERVGRLAENGFQADDGGHIGGDQVAQHVARADRGQLVDVADEQQVAVGADGLKQIVGQHQVEHRRLVDDDHISVDGVVLVATEALARLELQQAVDRLRLAPRGLRQSLGGPPRGRGQNVRVPCAFEQVKQRPQGRRLARPRPAGQDGQLVGQRGGDGLLLLGGESDRRRRAADHGRASAIPNS